MTTIKHLVLSGGADGGWVLYGALKHLANNNFFNIKNIKTIYAVSIGSLISVLISLDYNWNELDDYIIKRPWHKVISIQLANIFDMWKNKGILDIEIIVKIILDTLLLAKDLSETITLKEFYEYNNIEFHIYTVNINEKIPKLVDLSYKTHPDLELYKAIARSSAFPIIFLPIIDNDECYVDGGFINNFPLNECIINAEKMGDSIDEILAFKISNNNKLQDNNSIKDMEIHKYMYVIINKLFKLITPDIPRDISNIVYCQIDDTVNFSNWNDALNNESVRKELIEKGDKCGKEFICGGETPTKGPNSKIE